MKYLASLCLAALLLTAGCAHLIPGADPIVVRTEQTQAIAYTTIDEFLKMDAANYVLLRINAPEVHKAAEYLREWVQDGPVQQRRWVLYLLSLDRVKLAYKAGHATKNDLVTALAVVESAVTESQKNITAATHH